MRVTALPGRYARQAVRRSASQEFLTEEVWRKKSGLGPATTSRRSRRQGAIAGRQSPRALPKGRAAVPPENNIGHVSVRQRGEWKTSKSGRRKRTPRLRAGSFFFFAPPASLDGLRTWNGSGSKLERARGVGSSLVGFIGWRAKRQRGARRAQLH